MRKGYGMNPSNTGSISIDSLIKNVTNILSLYVIQSYDYGTDSKDKKTVFRREITSKNGLL